MFREKSVHILLFCSVVTICTAVLQYINPAYSFFNGGYIAAILLTVFLKQDWYTQLFGGISTLLIILPTLYTRDNVSQQQALLQHLFSLIVVVLATIFVLYVKKLYRSIEA